MAVACDQQGVAWPRTRHDGCLYARCASAPMLCAMRVAPTAKTPCLHNAPDLICFSMHATPDLWPPCPCVLQSWRPSAMRMACRCWWMRRMALTLAQRQACRPAHCHRGLTAPSTPLTRCRDADNLFLRGVLGNHGRRGLLQFGLHALLDCMHRTGVNGGQLCFRPEATCPADTPAPLPFVSRCCRP